MLPISSSLLSYPVPSVQQTEGSNITSLAWSEAEKALLARGTLPEHITIIKTQSNPLHVAVDLNDLELAKKIISLGFPINQPNDKMDSTALMRAIHFGFYNMALLLIENGADLTLQNEKGTYLHYAVGRENLILAEALIKHNPNLLNQEVTFYNPHPNLSLDFLSGAPFTMPATLNVSPLHLAMVLPNPLQGEKLAAFLIQQGAQINAITPEGFNYLHLAAARGYDEVCKLLINKGINIDSLCRYIYDSLNFQLTPLAYAVDNNHLNTVKTLLDQNASYDMDIGLFNNPFYKAVESEQEECIQLFLNRGASIDKLNLLGHPKDFPVLLEILAASHNEARIPLFNLLLKLGMNLNRRSSDQKTYLHHAVILNAKWLCELLLQHGADVNALDDNNSSAIHEANNPEIISLLLTYGANARALNNEARTPLMKLEHNSFSPPQLYKDLKAADKGMTACMRKLNLLGLRYSLPGEVFEGSPRFLPYFGLADSLESYLTQNIEVPEFVHLLPETIRISNHISSKDIIQKIERGEIVSLSAGWDEHETVVILSKDMIILGNRGDHCGNEPGLKIYKIKNPSNLSLAINNIITNRDFNISLKDFHPEFIKKRGQTSASEICKKMHEEAKEKHIDYFNNKIIEELNLERLYYLPLKEQITGNCTWMGAKMALKGILILHYLQQNPSKNVKDVLPLVKKIYSGWLKFDHQQSLSVLKEAEAEPLLKDRIDVEAVYDELLAANFFREEICEKLIALRPALQEKKNHPDSKLLTLAYKRHSTQLFQWLLEKGIEVKIPKFSMSTKPAIDELLLSYFIKKGIITQIPDATGITPLDYFCCKKNKLWLLKMLQALINECESTQNREALKKLVNNQDNEGFTPMHTLLRYSEALESVKEHIDLLLQSGADLTLETKAGNTPLYFAIFKINTPKDIEVFNSLLQACPDKEKTLNSRNQNGFTLFDIATNMKKYNEPVAQLLLDNGAGLTCMPSTLEFYTHKGLKLDLMNAEGNTPLHLLCYISIKTLAIDLLKAWKQECEQTNNLELLKQKVNAPNKIGITPLYSLFISEENLEGTKSLLSLLMECGADVSLSYNNEITPLHNAIAKVKQASDVHIIKMLLKNSSQAVKALNPLNPTVNPPLYNIDPNAEWSYTLAKLLIDHGALVYSNNQGIMYPGVLVKYPDLYQYYQEKLKKQQ